MIKPISYEQIIPTLRSHIIGCINIEPQFVRDAADIYGTDLDMKVSDTVFTSTVRNKCLILFSLYAADDDNDVSIQDTETKIIRCQSYDLKLLLYGDQSLIKAYELLSVLLTASSRQKMFRKGILIKTISNPETIKEFKNGSVWLRTDLTIHISCEHEIIKTEENFDLEKLNTLTIKELI